jgi:hypothetical protein
VTEYTYDGSYRLLTIKDARGIVFLTNEYDANSRVTKQMQADATTYQFAYVWQRERAVATRGAAAGAAVDGAVAELLENLRTAVAGGR